MRMDGEEIWDALHAATSARSEKERERMRMVMMMMAYLQQEVHGLQSVDSNEKWEKRVG